MRLWTERNSDALVGGNVRDGLGSKSGRRAARLRPARWFPGACAKDRARVRTEGNCRRTHGSASVKTTASLPTGGWIHKSWDTYTGGKNALGEKFPFPRLFPRWGTSSGVTLPGSLNLLTCPFWRNDSSNWCAPSSLWRSLLTAEGGVHSTLLPSVMGVPGWLHSLWSEGWTYLILAVFQQADPSHRAISQMQSWYLYLLLSIIRIYFSISSRWQKRVLVILPSQASTECYTARKNTWKLSRGLSL